MDYSANIKDFGMDTISLAGPLEAKLRAVREAGFTQIMLSARDIVGHPDGLDAAVAAVRASGLRVTGFQVLRDFEGLSGHLHDYKIDIAKSMLEMCSALGAQVLLVCSSTSVHATQEPQALARDLRKLAMLAIPMGIKVAYEALSWGRHVNQFPQAWDIVCRADMPNLGLGLDSFHLFATQTPLDELDMLDREYWAYSATNPGAVRFDVVRTVPVPHIILSGRPSPDHSWFPPFEWRMAHCCCGAHLGWSFTSPSRTSAYNLFLRTEVARIKAAQPELSHRDAFREAARNFRVEDHLGQSHGFHGLIVTNLRERRATAEQLHNRERLAADRLRTTRRIDSMIRVLFNEAAEEAQRTADDEGEEEGEDVEDEGEEEGEEEGEVGGEQAAHTSAAEHIGALLAAQADGNEPH
jgi:hypothetical protein